VTGGIHRTAYHSYEHDGYVPPLAVTYMGNTIYPRGKECFWQRNGSEIFSIELVTAGNISFRQDGRDYIVRPGEVFLVRRRSHNVFRTGPAGFAHKRFMVVEGEMLDTALEMNGLAACDHVPLSHPYLVAGLMKQAFGIMLNPGPDFAGKLSTIAYALLLELGRDSQSARTPDALRQALHFIRVNMSKKISGDTIAHQVGLSVASLNRLFREHLHISPIRYLTNQRMAYARQLLVSTSMPVKTIAFELGFSDPLYFSSQFSKHVGVSPRAFREGHGQRTSAPSPSRLITQTERL
jgi:AraC-like DNA-binding protein